MKAAVLHGKRDIRMENIPNPKVEPGSIVIKVRACGICGSDLHIYRQGDKAGLILGHEFSGDVYEIGAGVADFKKGDRVTGVGFRPCGECYWCKQGMTARCSNMKLAGDHFAGAMAEYVLLPNAQLNRTVFKLPDTVSYEQGATVEPVSVGSFSVRRAKVAPEDTCVVIGAGIIGLGIVQVLKAVGVKKVIAAGRRASRLKAAKESGADMIIDAAKEDTAAAVIKATKGLGADVVFECAGQQATFDQSLKIARGGGKVILVGLYEQPVTWKPIDATNKNLTLIGILGGHFTSTMEYMASGKVNTKPLISHTFPLDKAPEAFATQSDAPDAIKVMLKM
ncbi:MAG: alcohol dehydrogenase catalytic domain-containing protein [Dehalococcoidales bacterium]|nr:alcohol dehydrogenase catalytic domain-containing protein [Dehalococcoidales bacterium]